MQSLLIDPGSSVPEKTIKDYLPWSLLSEVLMRAKIMSAQQVSIVLEGYEVISIRAAFRPRCCCLMQVME